MSTDGKDALVRAAKKLFSEKGFSATSVRDITDEAKCNISLVSYYFNGKEGLYKACLDQYGKERLESAKNILSTPKTVEEFKVRLELFLSQILDSIANEPELTRLVHREFDAGAPIVEEFASTFKSLFETIMSFFECAKSNKLLRSDLEPRFAAYAVFGLLGHVSRTALFGIDFFDMKPLSETKSRQKMLEHLCSFITAASINRGGK